MCTESIQVKDGSIKVETAARFVKGMTEWGVRSFVEALVMILGSAFPELLRDLASLIVQLQADSTYTGAMSFGLHVVTDTGRDELEVKLSPLWDLDIQAVEETKQLTQNFQQLSVQDLKGLCSSKGLSDHGSKDALIKRLVQKTI